MKNLFKRTAVIVMTLALIVVGGIPQAEAANSHLIIVNSKSNKLGFFVNNKLVKEFRVATGKKGSETPTGKTRVTERIKNRPYYKGNIPGGSPKNPLGDRWLGLGFKSGAYGIHGNNNESSIGKHISGGCVRMHNKEIRWLFDQVPTGTTVIIDYSSDSYQKIAAKYKINLNQTGQTGQTNTVKAGFKTIKGETYYQKADGSYFKNGWLTVSGKVYFFDANGVMQKGWKEQNGKKYYLGADGARVSGWQLVNNKKYYFASTGELLTGWQTIGNNKYYLGTDGAMTTGWQVIDKNKYYLGTDGVLKTGWQQIDNKQYYLGTDGIMVTGKQTIEGKEYNFNADGTIDPNWDTVIGQNRFDTAKKVSTTGNYTAENTDTVILVNGNAIADGITATPLANSYNAPILLTNTNIMPNETLSELDRLKPERIMLIGGNNAIGTEVENQIRTKYKVEPIRIAGQTRYETAFKIAQELEAKEDIKTAYVVYGKGEPDALSIASKAGQDKQPIILTEKDALSKDVYDWLEVQQLESAYFIGGNTAISDNVIAEMDKITTADVSKNRVAGLNRADTNAKVISTFYKDANLNSVLVAKSDVLVDALTAGPLASKLGSPVVLMNASGLSAEQNAALNGKKSQKVYQIGGGINFKSIDKLVDVLK